MVLNRIVRRGVHDDPGAAFVIGRRNVDVPNSLKIPILVSYRRVTGRISDIGSEKTAGCPPGTASDGFILRRVLKTVYFWNTVEVFLNPKCFVAITEDWTSKNSYIDWTGIVSSEKTGA